MGSRGCKLVSSLCRAIQIERKVHWLHFFPVVSLPCLTEPLYGHKGSFLCTVKHNACISFFCALDFPHHLLLLNALLLQQGTRLSIEKAAQFVTYCRDAIYWSEIMLHFNALLEKKWSNIVPKYNLDPLNKLYRITHLHSYWFEQASMPV